MPDAMTDIARELMETTGLNITPEEAQAIHRIVNSENWKHLCEVVGAVCGMETEKIMLSASPVSHEEYVRTHGMVSGVNLFRIRAEEIASVWSDLLTKEVSKNA